MPQSQEGKQLSQGYHREVLTWKVRRRCMTSEGHCKDTLLVLKGYQNSHRQCHWGMLVGTWVSEETCIGAELCWKCWGCEKAPWTNLQTRQWWVTLQLFFPSMFKSLRASLILITRYGSFYPLFWCAEYSANEGRLCRIFTKYRWQGLLLILKCQGTQQEFFLLLVHDLYSMGSNHKLLQN